MNHFKLGLVYQHSFRNRYIIRETTLYVGDNSTERNLRIFSVVFPSSVKYINKNNSKLMVIGHFSFSRTSIEFLNIPCNVKLPVIESYAFYKCSNLSFSKCSKLKRIEYSTFEMTSIESFNIPSSVEEIG